MNRRSHRAISSSLVAALIGLGAPLFAQEAQAPRNGVCLREGEKLAGAVPVRIGKDLTPPKKVRNVQPNLPKPPKGTTVTGVWLGELLIGTDGKVVQVWTIREIQVTPPLPAFNRAIAEAMGAWEFEPLTIESKAVPGCTDGDIQDRTVRRSVAWRGLTSMSVKTYLLSFPERLVRAGLGLGAAVAREAGVVALPASVRRSQLYTNMVDATLRFLIEQVGGAERAADADALPESFVVLPDGRQCRRDAGDRGVWRPLPVWVLAALADLGGTGRHPGAGDLRGPEGAGPDRGGRGLHDR